MSKQKQTKTTKPIPYWPTEPPRVVTVPILGVVR
jgi:hypothetical protein